MMNIDAEQLAQAVRRLRDGGLVAFPTETVYGLGADALNADAVVKVFSVKNRPTTNPLIVHVFDEAMARSLASNWPDQASKLASAFWPGPLTIVVRRSDIVPEIVTAGGPTVAIRCPEHPVALSLLRAFDGPLVGPSANPSGFVSPTRAEHVRGAFTDADVLVLDGGACRAGIESTVVKVDAAGVTMLRFGPISESSIQRVLGVSINPRPDDTPGVQESPGRLSRHYAPRSPVVLIDESEVDDVLAAPGVVCLVSHLARETPPPHRLVALPSDAAGYAAGLYAALREADAMEPDLIAIERPLAESEDEDERSLWLAINDRLKRAASRG